MELHRDDEITTRFAHEQTMSMLNKSVSRRLRVLNMKLIHKLLHTFGGDRGDGPLLVTRTDKWIPTPFPRNSTEQANAAIFDDLTCVRIIRTTGYPDCSFPRLSSDSSDKFLSASSVFRSDGAQIAQSVYRLSTGWTAEESEFDSR
jgi:hypothetical protein